MRCLLPTCQVTWVNTIGMRRPKIDSDTFVRAFEKLGHWRPKFIKSTQLIHAGSRQGDASCCNNNPKILSPLMWPSFRSSGAKRINQRMISRALRRGVPELENTTVLTTIPVVADLVGSVPARRWVYYRVDDFAQWPGLDGDTIRRMEEKLIARVDCVIAAGDALAQMPREHGHNTILLTHGVDFNFWEAECAPASTPTCLEKLEKPLALFWGLLDERLDIAFLKTLSEQMLKGTIVLVGPRQNPSPDLFKIDRVRCVGELHFKELPAAAACCDVLIMPYADLPVTRAMQPLKLKEYLSTGKPVVARNLPAVDRFRDLLDEADSAGAFARLVQERIAGGLPEEQRQAREILRSESWSEKAKTLGRVLFD